MLQHVFVRIPAVLEHQCWRFLENILIVNNAIVSHAY